MCDEGAAPLARLLPYALNPMSEIEAVWTFFPGPQYAQEELLSYLPRWVTPERLPLAKQLFKRSAIRSRHLVVTPGDLIASGRSFAKKNAIYRSVLRDAVRSLCDRVVAEVGSEARDGIDLLVTASCTGFQIPAMDVLIIEELGLPVHLRRVNLTQHGCAAGAAAIGLAHEWLQSHPTRRALIVCAELCSLAFQPEDMSAENLVSAAIFGDGSAAVLMAGDEAAGRVTSGTRIVVRDTFREFFPATEHFMGFDVNESGLKIKLSQDVVKFAQNELPGLFARACESWSLPSPTAFETGSVHPGGRRILEMIEDEVGINRKVTQTSWDALERYGNLSSVSVLVALERLFATKSALRDRAVGLVSAFGPGFGAELSLLEVSSAPRMAA
jgi:alkylresorcinol/alkylpyrone synthase